MFLGTEKRIVFFDLETTGLDVENDRIVEIAVIRYAPMEKSVRWASLVNPGIPIPAAATALHRITDVSVASAPPFAQLAPALWRGFSGADVGGFNVRTYDIPLIEAEFRRCGLKSPFDGARIVDVLDVYRRMYDHTLAGAVKAYLRRSHDGAHSAVEDIESTVEVLNAQVLEDGIPQTVAEMDAWLMEGRENYVDPGGKLVRDEAGTIVVNFGKYKGTPLNDVDPGFLRWMLDNAFSPVVKNAVRGALGGGET